MTQIEREALHTQAVPIEPRQYETAARRYRIVFRTPPVRDAQDDGSKAFGQGSPSGSWAVQSIVLEAFNLTEAVQRLEFRLLNNGFYFHGQPSLAIYRIVDIRPDDGR